MAEGMFERLESLLRRLVQLLETGVLIGGYVDQTNSPLGRKHNQAVRRRVQDGKDGAWIVGRVHLLSADALKEELKRETLTPALTFPHPADNKDEDFHANLMREVGAE